MDTYDAEAARTKARKVIKEIAERSGGNKTTQGTLQQICRVVVASSELADSHVSDLTRASGEYLAGAKTNARWMRVLTTVIALSTLGYLVAWVWVETHREAKVSTEVVVRSGQP